MTKENFVTLSLIFLVLFVATAYTWSLVQKHKVTALNNSQAGVSLSADEQTSSYTDLEGNPIMLNDYLGDILVVNSWASWCPSCGNEMKKIAEVTESYEREGVRFLGINRAEQSTTAERFLRTVDGVDGMLLILDPDDRYYRSIDGYAMPETVIYDSLGNIVYHHHGEITVDQIKKYLDSAIFTTTSSND